MTAGRTFLSTRIYVLLTVKRINEIPHRRFALNLHVDFAHTPFSRFQLSHVPFLRGLYRRITQHPLFFRNNMLALTSVLRYLVEETLKTQPRGLQ